MGIFHTASKGCQMFSNESTSIKWNSCVSSVLLRGLTSSCSFCTVTSEKTRLPSSPQTAFSSSLFRENSWAPVRIPRQSTVLQKTVTQLKDCIYKNNIASKREHTAKGPFKKMYAIITKHDRKRYVSSIILFTLSFPAPGSRDRLTETCCYT